MNQEKTLLLKDLPEKLTVRFGVNPPKFTFGELRLSFGFPLKSSLVFHGALSEEKKN